MSILFLRSSAAAGGGGGGDFVHGESFQLTGSSFGVKSTVAPMIFDQCTGSDPLSSGWGLALPRDAVDTTKNMQYRAVGYRSVAGPHARATHYAVGGTAAGFSTYGGSQQSLHRGRAMSLGDKVYGRCYMRADPAWDFDTTDDLDGAANRNFKFFVLNLTQGGEFPYETDPDPDGHVYLDYEQAIVSNGLYNTTNSPSVKMSPAPGHPTVTPDNNAHTHYWSQVANPMSNWPLYEFEYELHTSAGRIRMWADGVLKVDYLGPTTYATVNYVSMGFGGYVGAFGNPGGAVSNCWRYFSDAYVDDTWQRVVLANNATLSSATIREIQLPTAWNGTVTVTANCGKFTSGQTAYLCVTDTDGVQIGTGQAVTVA